MDPIRWYEADHSRLVLEYLRVGNTFPEFALEMRESEPVWVGALYAEIPTQDIATLRVELHYPPAYPFRPPRIMPITPTIPPEHWGHRWHRYEEGFICIVEPSDWEPEFTAADALAKAADWFFNYRAYTAGIIDAMPDIGRAELVSGQGAN